MNTYYNDIPNRGWKNISLENLIDAISKSDWRKEAFLNGNAFDINIDGTNYEVTVDLWRGIITTTNLDNEYCHYRDVIDVANDIDLCHIFG